MRTCIFGGPRTGKTHRAAELVGRSQRRVRHTDDLINRLKWSEVSQHIADDWLTQPGPWIIEGVAVGRALRKWLAVHPEGKPCDEVLLLWRPHVALTRAQAGMGQGCKTVWAVIRDELLARGVRVVEL